MPPDRTLLPCSLHPPRSQCCVPPCPPLQSPPSAALGMQQGHSAGLEELPPPLSPSLLPSLRLVACTCLSLQFFNRCVFRSGLFGLAEGPLLQGSTGSLALQPAGWMLPFDTGTCWIEGVLVWERGDPSPLSLRLWGLRGLPTQVSAQCPSPCWVSRLLVCLWQLPPALGTAGALCRVRGPSAPAGLSQEPCGYRRALCWGRQRAAGSHSLVVQMGTAHLGSLDMLHLQEHRGRMQTPKKQEMAQNAAVSAVAGG